MSGNGDHYNKAGLLAFLGSFGFVVVFMIYLVVAHEGVDLDTVREAGSGVQIAKRFNPDALENPWVSSEELIKHGNKVYTSNCASCHGPEGAGNGPAAAGLNPKPRNLIAGDWKWGGDQIGLYKTLANGAPVAGSVMLGYKAMLSAGDRWALVHWIQEVTKNKKMAAAEEVAQFAQGAE